MSVAVALRNAFSAADPSRRRGRVMLAVGSLLAIAYALAWPMLESELARSRMAAQAAQASVERARAASGDIAGLQRASRAVREGDPAAALARASAELGAGAAITSAEVVDGRLRVVLAGIAFDRLARLVEALGRNEGLFLVEALLVPRVEPGSVRAELTFSRTR